MEFNDEIFFLYSILFRKIPRMPTFVHVVKFKECFGLFWEIFKLAIISFNANQLVFFTFFSKIFQLESIIDSCLKDGSWHFNHRSNIIVLILLTVLWIYRLTLLNETSYYPTVLFVNIDVCSINISMTWNFSVNTQTQQLRTGVFLIYQ